MPCLKNIKTWKNVLQIILLTKNTQWLRKQGTMLYLSEFRKEKTWGYQLWYIKNRRMKEVGFNHHEHTNTNIPDWIYMKPIHLFGSISNQLLPILYRFYLEYWLILPILIWISKCMTNRYRGRFVKQIAIPMSITISYTKFNQLSFEP